MQECPQINGKSSWWISYSRQQIPTLARPFPLPRPTGHIASSICNMEHNYTNFLSIALARVWSEERLSFWAGASTEQPASVHLREQVQGEATWPLITAASPPTLDCPSVRSFIPSSSCPSFLIPYFPPTPISTCTVKRNLEKRAKVFRVCPSFSASLYGTDIYVTFCSYGKMALYFIA